MEELINFKNTQAVIYHLTMDQNFECETLGTWLGVYMTPMECQAQALSEHQNNENADYCNQFVFSHEYPTKGCFCCDTVLKRHLTTKSQYHDMDLYDTIHN